MNRLAVFVEGFTELSFVTKLIEEIAGKKNVQIEWRRIRGGSSTRRTSALMRASRPGIGQQCSCAFSASGVRDETRRGSRQCFRKLAHAGRARVCYVTGMDAIEQLKEDLRQGRIDANRLVELMVTLQAQCKRKRRSNASPN